MDQELNLNHTGTEMSAINDPAKSNEPPIHNASEVGADGAFEQHSGARPKRTLKPTLKALENRIQADKANLDKIWKRTVAAIDELNETPNSVELIRFAVSKIRSTFNEYRSVWLAFMDFTADGSSADCQRERKIIDELTKTRSDFVKSAINEGNDRKNDLLQETGSVRSGSSRGSTSSAVRAQAKANAAAALKKAEMQKHRQEIECQYKFLLEQEQLALERKRKEQEVRLESLRLDEEAAVALARVNAIEEELAFDQHLHLPTAHPRERVREFVDSAELTDPSADIPYDSAPGRRCLNPAPPVLQPPPDQRSQRNPKPESNTMETFVQFMARRELIANKIEKFDDNPENFNTWKAAFKNMIRNINITPSEELTLMIEYTTKDSKKLVQRLRNAFIRNAAEGVEVAWKKIGERFGSRAVITQVHLKKLDALPKLGRKDNKGLQDLGDLLLELQCAKKDGELSGLRILDEPSYLKPIITKLPEDIQGRWQKHAYRYNVEHGVDYPPFDEFVKLIQIVSRERNDPFLAMEIPDRGNPSLRKPSIKPFTVNKTEVSDYALSNWCIVHKKPHALASCRAFRAKPFNERSLLRQHGVCLRCVATCTHLAKDCKASVQCTDCQSDRHVTALHAGPPAKPPATQDGEQHGGEHNNVTTRCTELCGNMTGGKSCSKICLANVYIDGNPETKIKTYVVIDDQSNCSLTKSKLFELLKLEGEITSYTLKTCSGTSQAKGRRAQGLVIESLDGHRKHRLPTLTECNAIPDGREEIPTPAVARVHPHLRVIADKIPELDPEADILLLIGRDLPPLHKVHESRNGPRNAPWAQRLDLGWVVVGNACLDGAHKPDGISTYRTEVLHNGRPSFLQPCPNRFNVKYNTKTVSAACKGDTKKGTFIDGRFHDGLGNKLFIRTKDDNKPGTSVEDRKFIDIMKQGMVKNPLGNWEAPLPFRDEIIQLPNNREDALKRLKSTRRTLDKRPSMKKDYFAFMQKVFENGHAELVPQRTPESPDACWYLPHFGVYHPQKPGKIRVVFDSAAEKDGVSLNKLLLSGPDLTNNLLGVLLRFRQEPVAFMADIEQMFHSFYVQEQHRDFLRFLWYKDNDPDQEVIEYRMKVHIFGNTSSPAVATYALRKTAEIEETAYGSDAKNFVHNNFYVDDGLKSVSEPAKAVDLLRRTQAMLATANLHLHKIASSHSEVMQAFRSEDQATSLRDLDFSKDTIPVQRSLGVFWDIRSDTFTFRVTSREKPFTRRGVLSVINSLYDPIGLVAPVVIKGKLLLRSMSDHLHTSQPEDWDKLLPEEHKPAWEAWCQSLSALENLNVPRSYSPRSLEATDRREIHTFCDASSDAIGAVSYLRTIQPNDSVQVSFVLGKAKLAPSQATTIPRLELCAAVLGIELTETITEELDLQPDSVTYYSDSKVVLGYITNPTRRFYVYVSNRVERITRSSTPDQWHYVQSSHNPADLATRPSEAQNLQNTIWHTGPKFLESQDPSPYTKLGNAASESKLDDPEVRLELKTLATQVRPSKSFGCERFSRFSQWSTLLKAISRLIMVARSYRQKNLKEQRVASATPQVLDQAKSVIIKTVQGEAYRDVIDRLKNSEKQPKSSSLLKLCPVIDAEGLLRVGGRLDRASLSKEERHPLILPSPQHVATLLVRHYHAKVQHQGRHFTLGAIRSSGFWVVGGKRLVASIIDKCIKCKKLRGSQQQQKMADLPVERLTPAPPFSYVGLDVFGPWQVAARRTRGGMAHSKRWAVLFTCLTTRAIHIELIESLDSSSFINALRRFLALRGPAIQLRSDCETNFVGAQNELDDASLREMDKEAIQAHLVSEGCEWIFNPPHASHAGGVWERMIGIVDSVLADLKPSHLTHEVLSTFMAEVSAIVNARPLTPVPNDPDMPEILTPATLLTQKPGPLKATPGNFTNADLFSKQWRRVQYLANVFWSRWRKEYLPTLQPRRKWQKESPNLEEGDLVLLRCKEAHRNDWPLARIIKAYPSADGKVRKVEVMTTKDGSRRSYVRPVTETILLRTERNFERMKTKAG